MNSPSVLLLVHQGFSFADDLIKLNDSLGLKSIVLSSKIKPENAFRAEILSRTAAIFKASSAPSILPKDIDALLAELAEQDIRPIACISVWEGYRILMAQTNRRLGAQDEDSGKIAALLDKYSLRKSLLALGLSQTQSRVVDIYSPTFGEKPTLFVKPRWGLGSFGAFKWHGENIQPKLFSLRQQMQTDADYAGVFPEIPEFVAEDEICGREYSFEVIVNNGAASILATHEKLALSEEHGTVLENACVSPPIEISEETLGAGTTFIRSVLSALSIRQGCYHIEARFDNRTGLWEIIEINPRIGGAYISQSTQWVSGLCLLRLWLENIVGSDRWAQIGQKSLLSKLKDRMPTKGKSFFRVFYGEPGRRVERLLTSSDMQPPSLYRQIIKDGTDLPPSNREIFLGQALWLLDASAPNTQLSQLCDLSQNFLEVQYA